MMRSRLLRSQAGVAMISVLLVGAALTAMATTAAFVTVREMRAGDDDRKGAISLAHAEAGVDRLFNYLRSGRITWGQIRNAGCTVQGRFYPPLTFVGGAAASPAPANGGQGQLSADGSFQVALTVFDPTATGEARFPPDACTSPTNPRVDSARTKQFFAITSMGRSPAASRVVRQVLQIGTFGLPVGVFADSFNAAGSPDFENTSLIVRNDVTGRKFMDFTGTDPYYVRQDFWPTLDATAAPSGIHGLGTIFTTIGLLKGQEHPSSESPKNPDPNLSCDSNRTGTQSKWDQSGKGGTITGNCSSYLNSSNVLDLVAPPPSSLMTQDLMTGVAPRPELTPEDYQALRLSARERGLYCNYLDPPCYANGVRWPGFTALGVFNSADIASRNFEDNFVAYFDVKGTPSTTDPTAKWQAAYGRCADPEPEGTPNKSVTIIVRDGNLAMTAGGDTWGAALVPEGTVTKGGGSRLIGTIIAKEVRSTGTARFANNSCWVKNMPGPFLDFTPTHFSEIDR